MRIECASNAHSMSSVDRPLFLRPKKHFKNEKRSKDAAAKKRPNTSGVGKINNYYEDISIYTSL